MNCHIDTTWAAAGIIVLSYASWNRREIFHSHHAWELRPRSLYCWLLAHWTVLKEKYHPSLQGFWLKQDSLLQWGDAVNHILNSPNNFCFCNTSYLMILGVLDIKITLSLDPLRNQGSSAHQITVAPFQRSQSWGNFPSKNAACNSHFFFFLITHVGPFCDSKFLLILQLHKHSGSQWEIFSF